MSRYLSVMVCASCLAAAFAWAAESNTTDYTCFQTAAPYAPELDIGSDVAVVYGVDETFAGRVAGWREHGYTAAMMTGISWGGSLTSLVSGVDTRFRFAAPVYGCGHYLETTFGDRIRGLGADRADRWMRWWDPSVYLKNSTVPMLWVTGSNDFAYWFPALQKSYRIARGSRTLCVRLRMSHGQESGEIPEEIRVFADSILKGADPLPRITNQGRDGSLVWATFESKHPLSKAELNYTKDSGKWPNRQWESVPAGVEGKKVSASLPEGATTYYLNLFDDRGCVVSTEHEELAPPKP